MLMAKLMAVGRRLYTKFVALDKLVIEEFPNTRHPVAEQPMMNTSIEMMTTIQRRLKITRKGA